MMPSNYCRVESRISESRIESFGPKTICRPVAIRWTKVSDFCDLKLRLFEELKEIPLRPFIHRCDIKICIYIQCIYMHNIYTSYLDSGNFLLPTLHPVVPIYYFKLSISRIITGQFYPTYGTNF